MISCEKSTKHQKQTQYSFPNSSIVHKLASLASVFVLRSLHEWLRARGSISTHPYLSLHVPHSAPGKIRPETCSNVTEDLEPPGSAAPSRFPPVLCRGAAQFCATKRECRKSLLRYLPLLIKTSLTARLYHMLVFTRVHFCNLHVESPPVNFYQMTS